MLVYSTNFLKLLFFIFVSVTLSYALKYQNINFNEFSNKKICFRPLSHITVSNSKLFSVRNLPKGFNGDPNCKVCQGKAGMNCATCKGSGIDRVNGNIFERWTCSKCKGFGYVPCSSCNKNSRGLTPEQTGER